MANGNTRDIASVRADLRSLSRSVSEGNVKTTSGSPILRGGSRGGDGKKGTKKK